MEEVVPLLYHYTSINSLRSIIESKSIWMTNILYQNDYEEYYHGLALVEEVLKSDYPGLEVPINFKEHKPVDVYTFSLSTEKDQLSQWRGYCPNGGCSFSFDANHHKNIMTSLYGYAVSPIKLGKVLYNKNDKIDFIKKEMIGFSPEDYFAAQRSQYGMYNRAMPNYYKYLKVMARRITGLATLLKNEGFKEEKEWRFYTFKEYSMIGIGYYYEYARPLPFTTKFREGKNNLIPYIEVPLVINLPEALKNILFDEIVIGPNQDIDLAERSLYAYLGKRAKKITISKIPYINR